MRGQPVERLHRKLEPVLTDVDVPAVELQPDLANCVVELCPVVATHGASTIAHRRRDCLLANSQLLSLLFVWLCNHTASVQRFLNTG